MEKRGEWGYYKRKNLSNIIKSLIFNGKISKLMPKEAGRWIGGRKGISVAAAIALVAVGVAVWALFFRDPSPAPAPDIAPPVEDNALPTGEDDGDKLPQAQGGGAVNITYSDQVAVCLETRTVSLRFANPARSNQSMVVRLVLGELVAAESGTLPPGSALESLPLLADVTLPAGEYAGAFHVLFYDSQDGGRAGVSTKLPVSVTVA